MRAYKREWYLLNKGSELERARLYREENRDRIRAKARADMREKRAANKEKFAEYARAWKAANPDRVKQYDANKSAKRRNAIGADRITAEEWRAIKERYKHCCVYCLKRFTRLQMDHVVPLSRGGTHTIDNIVPACRSCNSSKQAKDVLEWVNEKHGRLF